MELGRREVAEEALRAAGVALAEAHGSVEDLKALIRKDTAISQNARDSKLFNANSQCVGKVRHASIEAAERVARRMRRFHDVHRYHCQHCGGWHLGKTPKRG